MTTEDDVKLSSITIDEDAIDCRKYRMILKTMQSNAIKTLFESLKDILNDVNMKIDKSGIQIMTMDGKRITIVHLKLNASSFEFFHCSSPFKIGINMKSLHMLLRTVGNNDVITMCVRENEYTRLEITIENKEKNVKDISKLKLLDINEHTYQIPNIEFDSVIKMSSSDFQKICKDLSNISDNVTIKSEDKKFIMSVEGDIGQKEIVIGETSNVAFNKSSNTVIQNRYDLKYLLLFVKSSNLCSTVELYLKNNLPLILVYSVANLGNLKFVLAPKSNEDDYEC